MLIPVFLFAISLFPLQIYPWITRVIFAFTLFLLPTSLQVFLVDLKKRDPITIFFLFFLLSAALSTIFSVDKTRSLATLALYACSFVIFTYVRAVYTDFNSKRMIAYYFLLITFVLSLIALYNTLVLHHVDRSAEGASFMWIYYGHNHLSALLLFAIPLAFYFLSFHWKNVKLRISFIVLCLFLLISLFFTFARASMLSLFAAALFSLFLIPRVPRRISFAIIAFTICVIGMIGFYGLVIPKTKISFGYENPRIIYWKQAIESFQKHPLLGTGPDTFRYVQSSQGTFLKLHSYYTHNFFLQVLSDNGIIGFISAVGLICVSYWQTVKKLIILPTKFIQEKGFLSVLFIGVLASGLNSLVDFDWQLPTVFLTFWIMTGLLQKMHK